MKEMNKEAQTLLIANLAAAELRAILGVEVSGPQLKAADEASVKRKSKLTL